MTPAQLVARAEAVTVAAKQAVAEGKLTEDLGYAVLTTELLNLSIDAHSQGFAEVSVWALGEASTFARRWRIELDVARAGDVPDSPEGLSEALRATESDES